jgi:hypothetical protein
MHCPLDSNGRLLIPRSSLGLRGATWAEGLASSNVVIDSPRRGRRAHHRARARVEVSGRCVDELDRPIPGKFEISPLPRPGELPRGSSRKTGDSECRTTKDDGAIELRIEPGRVVLQPQESQLAIASDPPCTGMSSARTSCSITRTGPVTNLVVQAPAPRAASVVKWSGPWRERCASVVPRRGRHACRSDKPVLAPAADRCALAPGLWQVRVLDSNGVSSAKNAASRWAPSRSSSARPGGDGMNRSGGRSSWHVPSAR